MQYRASLASLAGYTRDLFVEESLHLKDAGVTYFSPESMCPDPSASWLDCTSGLGGRLVHSPRHGYRMSHEVSVWNQPKITQQLTDTLLKASPAVSASELQAEQQRAAHLDNAFRSIYFSTDVNYAYIGFDGSEVYRQFPYEPFSSLPWAEPRACDAKPSLKISTFTPICRPWYQNGFHNSSADESVGSIVVNPVTTALTTGSLFISISAAVWMSNSRLGVVAIDAPIDTLSSTIAGCQYRAPPTGSKFANRCLRYSFVWHDNSDGTLIGGTVDGVLHKNYYRSFFMAKESTSGEQSSPLASNGMYVRTAVDEGNRTCTSGTAFDEQNRGPAPITFLEGGCDAEFRDAFNASVVVPARARLPFVWSRTWNNPDGGSERWYYSVAPVPGTPYMLATATLEQAVTERPDEATRKLVDEALRVIIPTICISVPVVLALFLFIQWANRRVAQPIASLYKCVSEWNAALSSFHSDSLYDSKVNEQLAAIQSRVSSLELTTIVGVFQKLAVALRFGEASKDPRAEFRNNLNALQLVRDKASGGHMAGGNVDLEMDQTRGFGVCHANMASLLAPREELVANASIRVQFELAVNHGRQLSEMPSANAKVSNDAHNVAADRMFKMALWLLDAGVHTHTYMHHVHM